MRDIQKNKFYQHYKGGIYYVLEVGTHTETEEEMVVYQSLNGDNRTWVRPKEMFLSLVETDVENPMGQTYRFEEVKDIKSLSYNG